MKKILSVLIAAIMLAVTALPFAVSAEDDTLLVDLRPGEAQEMEVSGCTIEYESDGTAIITLTSAYATIDIWLVRGGVTYSGEPIDVTGTAYAVADYASADGVYFDDTVQAHYTRADKSGTVADLWLKSLLDVAYADYQKAIGGERTSGDSYVVWDWGTYVNRPGKVFDDHMHSFTSIHYILHGEVGKKMYIYKFGIYNTAELDLGTRRPEPTVVETPSEDPGPAESSEESNSDEPVEGQIYDFLSTAASAKVNESVGGGTIRAFLPSFNLENSNTKWSVNVLLKKVEDGKYEVQEAAPGAGSENYAGPLAEDEILLAIHSDGEDQNAEGKNAALTLQKGDFVLFEYDANNNNITKCVAVEGEHEIVDPSEDETPSEVPSEDETPSEEEPSEDETPSENADAESKPEESKPAESKGGLPTGAVIGIIAGAVVIIGAVVAIILKKKKK